MGTTPVLVKGLTQVNTTDAAVSDAGTAFQLDGQLVGLADGGYMVVWTDQSDAYYAVVGQRFDRLGNRVGGEINFDNLTGTGIYRYSPAIAAFEDGNFVVAQTHDTGNREIAVED